MLLLRHASAGERRSTSSLDRARPLDATGRAQASALVGALGEQQIDCIVSSPHARCLETVEPLARVLGTAVEVRPELEPDTDLPTTLALLAGLPENALVCTHREVLERVFDGALTCEKGGAWLVERHDGLLVPHTYVPPPAVPAESIPGVLVS